jgi:hypothetical protein
MWSATIIVCELKANYRSDCATTIEQNEKESTMTTGFITQLRDRLPPQLLSYHSFKKQLRGGVAFVAIQKNQGFKKDGLLPATLRSQSQ